MICSRTQGNPYTIERGMTIVLIRIESAINLRRLSKTSDLPPTYLCRGFICIRKLVATRVGKPRKLKEILEK